MKLAIAGLRRRFQAAGWVGTGVALLFAVPVVGDETADPTRLTLERIFDGEEFSIKPFGPARWLADGSGYTTLELSPDFEETSVESTEESQSEDTQPKDAKPKDIVRYDPASGDRTVLLSAKSLIPEEGEEPIEIGTITGRTTTSVCSSLPTPHGSGVAILGVTTGFST